MWKDWCQKVLNNVSEQSPSKTENRREQFAIQIHGNRSTGRNVTVQEEDENPDAGRIFEGDWFNLTEVLRQHSLLEIPIQPLHDENCSGLCPHCGQDLNIKSCSCREDDMPSPFAVLAKFR